MIELDRTPLARIRGLAARGVPAWLCVNPVEYHGPHLSLQNDALLADALARDTHTRLATLHPDWPLVHAGELGVGVDATPGPGSRDVPAAELVRLLLPRTRRLASLGFRRVVLMSFHGSPFHNAAVWEAAQDLQARGVRVLAPMNLLFARIMRPEGEDVAAVHATISDPATRARVAARAREELHAGFFETSLALHYIPGTVRDHPAVPPAPALVAPRPWRAAARAATAAGRAALARDLETVGLGIAWYSLRPFPGYTSEPAAANPAAGALLAKLITTAFAQAAEEVLVQGAECPSPPLAWVSRITARGRIGRVAVPRSTWADQSA